MYNKHDKNVLDVYTVNKHLIDAILAALGNQEEGPIASENVETHPPKEYHPHIRELPRKHEDLCSEKVGNIHATSHRMDLIPGTRTFNSAPYLAGSKERELEEFERKHQLAAGFIERSHSEWATPILFEPTKNERLRFCVDYRKRNTMTFDDSYPLPIIDESIDSLGDACMLSTLAGFNCY